MTKPERPLHEVAGNEVLAVMVRIADQVLSDLRRQYAADMAAARPDPAAMAAVHERLAAIGQQRIRAVLDDMVAYVQANWPRTAATLAADETSRPT